MENQSYFATGNSIYFGYFVLKALYLEIKPLKAKTLKSQLLKKPSIEIFYILDQVVLI